MNHKVRYLSRAEVEQLGITMAEVIEQTELAFSEKGHGRGMMPPKHWIATDRNRFFSAMSGALPGIDAVACKWQSGSDRNAAIGLPYITGLLFLNRIEDGLPIAIMDSTWITATRTAAATAVTARHLAKSEPGTLGIIGCGVQGRANVEALACVHDGIGRVQAYDIDPRALASFVRDIGERFAVLVVPSASARQAVAGADIVVTCGPIVPDGDRRIGADWIKPGGLLVTLDYDCYLAPDALSDADAVFTDDLEQMRHLADYGFFQRHPARVVEIGAVVAGSHAGRAGDEQRIIAVNMGIALEDVALASLIHARAAESGAGVLLDL
jgi:ornithine cyclodeaminase/alanine dehydrogenase-like protein (mu-crystallin family)